ncbi:MAG: HAD-IC family P-type ATPase, partial [Anaerolineaceae bacterium]
MDRDPTNTSSPTQSKNTAHIHHVQTFKKLLQSATVDGSQALDLLNSTPNGLSEVEATARQEKYGPNEVAKEERKTWYMSLWNNVKNPLVILLVVLGVITFITGDIRATIMIMVMVLLGIVLRYVQERRADTAAEKLQAMVNTTATIIRDGKRHEIPLKELVPGDIVTLSAGDMVPADVRVLSSKDLFINQSALTGESLPVEKYASASDKTLTNALEMTDLCFLGSDVESGTGTALVVQTGSETYFGSMAISITGERQLTSFDKGLSSFTWLMIKLMAVMVPLVFLFNGLSNGNWLEAFLYALAVAVGLT